jgi:hypothetical protein
LKNIDKIFARVFSNEAVAKKNAASSKNRVAKRKK